MTINGTCMRSLCVLAFVCATAAHVAAQPFANAGTSLARYTVADATPSKACDALSSFKSGGIVSISARMVVATADTPQHCRVIGVIAPEVAFEVNLPDRWNRRDGQDCPAGAKTFGIFCALKRASVETIGEFDEVSPVMREARQVIDFVAARQYSARLVDYNNDPATSFADVKWFFRILRNRLSRKIAG